MKKATYFIIGFILFLLIVSCKHTIDINLGAKYRLRTDQNYKVFIGYGNNEPFTQVIDGQILKCAFDSTFVIVAQRPRDSVPKCRENKLVMTYDEYNEAFENSKFEQYWIINKKEKRIYSYDSVTESALYSNVYGPFKKKEYLQKRKELGVPKELVLAKIK